MPVKKLTLEEEFNKICRDTLEKWLSDALENLQAEIEYEGDVEAGLESFCTTNLQNLYDNIFDEIYIWSQDHIKMKFVLE